LGGALEEGVSHPTPSSFAEHLLLSLKCHLKERFACFGIAGYGAQGDVNDHIGSVCSGAKVSTARLTMFGTDVFAIFQVNQRPVLSTASEDNMPTPAAVTAIWPPFGYILFTTEVHSTIPTFS
jgi:hypothetical protein